MIKRLLVSDQSYAMLVIVISFLYCITFDFFVLGIVLIWYRISFMSIYENNKYINWYVV